MIKELKDDDVENENVEENSDNENVVSDNEDSREIETPILSK